MPILYRIYSNNGAGGPVDYSAPLASAGGLSYVAPALSPGGDVTFAVRAFDSDTNLEEANTTARVRVRVDGWGVDVSGLPNPPQSLTATATAAGGCLARWLYNPAGQGGDPAGFYVYLAAGATPSYATPAANVAYAGGPASYSCPLSGLSDRTTYAVAVRSYNAAGVESNVTAVVAVRGDSTAPDDVDSLSAAVV